MGRSAQFGSAVSQKAPTTKNFWHSLEVVATVREYRLAKKARPLQYSRMQTKLRQPLRTLMVQISMEQCSNSTCTKKSQSRIEGRGHVGAFRRLLFPSTLRLTRYAHSRRTKWAEGFCENLQQVVTCGRSHTC